MQKTYVLKWYHGSDPRYGWFIRGIRPDGTFYGEIRRFSQNEGKQIDIKGELSKIDLIQFLKSVNEIQQTVSALSNEPWIGLLAEGPVTDPHPNILYHYLKENRKDTHADRCFEELIGIFLPYMEKFYDNLK